jgi:hypothetical protein
MNVRLPSTKPFGSLAMALVATALPVLSLFSAASVVGCGGDEVLYVPKPAVSGKKPSLAAVPTLPTKSKKVGDAYSIWGVTHDLRSRVHAGEVNGQKISLVGYIVKTNYDTSPPCSIHKTGKGDPADCKAPIPTFSIADDKGETHDMIDVMGWASNPAQLFMLITAIDKAAKGKESEVKLKDEFWATDIPNPLPNVGAKVKVSGTYGVTFTKATGGAAANPKYGIMTAEKIEYLEPPTDKVYLPGMKKK